MFAKIKKYFKTAIFCKHFGEPAGSASHTSGRNVPACRSFRCLSKYKPCFYRNGTVIQFLCKFSSKKRTLVLFQSFELLQFVPQSDKQYPPPANGILHSGRRIQVNTSLYMLTGRKTITCTAFQKRCKLPGTDKRKFHIGKQGYQRFLIKR